MINYILIFVTGLALGVIGGYFGHKMALRTRYADGICTQFPDGEMYLRISEEGQEKLKDPQTEVLYIRVLHPQWKKIPRPRNVQPL